MSILKFKEPLVAHTNELTKLELINLLNTYYLHPDNSLDVLKEYLSEYIVRNNKQNLLIKVNKINTYHPCLIIARLITQGWVVDIKTQYKLDSYLNKLSQLHSKLKDDNIIIKQSKNKESTEVSSTEHLYNIDSYLDLKMFGRNPSFVYPVETQVLKIKNCIDYLDKQILSLTEDIKDKVIDRELGKLGINALTSLRDEYSKAKVSSKPKSRAINKNAMVKSVKHQIKNFGKMQKSFIPLNAVGKKKMYVYDESKKLLLCYFSTTGFTFSGTTLKDFTDKSLCVKIKDTTILTNSLSELNDIISKATNVKEVPHGRFNESSVIVALS